MKRFTFPFEKVLDRRGQLYTAARYECHLWKEKERFAQQEHARFLERLQEEVQRYRKALSKTARSADVQFDHLCLEGLEKHAHRVRERVRQAAVLSNQAREKMLARFQEKKALDLLKEKKFLEYQRQVETAEQKAVDGFFQAVVRNRKMNDAKP